MKGDLPILLKWIKERQSKPEVYGTALLSVRPNDNVLIGRDEIANYLRCSPYIARRWMENFNLPIMRRPDGVWMSTISSLDQWIWLACFAENEARLEAKKNADKNPERSPDKLRRGSEEQSATRAASDHGVLGHNGKANPGATANAVPCTDYHEAKPTQTDEYKNSD